MGWKTLTTTEKKVATTFANSLFGVVSVHFALVALWLVIIQHARAPLFGQREDISGFKLVVWATLLTLCGVSGLVSLTTKSKRAAKIALECWLLLSVFHTWCVMVMVSRRLWVNVIGGETQQTWAVYEMAVQLLTDVMSSAFLMWFLHHDGRNGVVMDDSMREPLLSHLV
ncbi:hypothetical protein F444_09468 [Phytophthora nicotianae P1976]|uniref:Uncharacterized protein n=1 Tax=Phytophthora nicotianae P1976 TaxID=1317066 RepID=A0A081A7K2_PHYNI|nr:hypothetical protein F444_09468 [Phytophthora nicotianae P1976]